MIGRDEAAQPTPEATVGRRLVLKATAVGAVGVAVSATGVEPAGAELLAGEVDCTDTITIWQLASDWDEPRGPHGKTRLVSKASRTAAANRYALSEAECLEMNLHVCSHAPAVPVEVCRKPFMEIWDHLKYTWRNPWLDKDVEILDARCLPHMEGGDELWRQAFCSAEPAALPTSTPAPKPSGTSGVAGDGLHNTPAPVAAAASAPAAPERRAAAATPARPAVPARLPVTGSEGTSLAGLGLGLVAAGTFAKVVAERSDSTRDSETRSSV